MKVLKKPVDDNETNVQRAQEVLLQQKKVE